MCPTQSTRSSASVTHPNAKKSREHIPTRSFSHRAALIANNAVSITVAEPAILRPVGVRE